MAKRLIHKDIWEWNSDRAQATAQKFKNSSNSVCVQNFSGKPEHIGTTVLFTMNGSHLLITAQHVLENLKGLDVGIFGDHNGISIRGCQVALLDDPSLDIAIVVLTRDQLKYMTTFRFLTVSDCADETYEEKDSNYLVLGFNKSRHVKARTYKFSGSPFTTTQLRSKKLVLPETIDNHKHLILEFNPKDTHNKTQWAMSPQPRGYSGGPIFCFGPRADGGVDDAKLIGITIEWHSKKVLVGTRVSSFLRALKSFVEKTGNVPSK